MIGQLLGTIILSILMALINSGKETITTFGPRITDFNAIISKYGVPIAKGYGTYRFPGNIIWASEVTEALVVTEQCEKTGGFFGLFKKTVCQETKGFEYYQSIALAFSAGEGAVLSKIWANGFLILDLEDGELENVNGLISTTARAVGFETSYVFYTGNNTKVSSIMERFEGVGQVPAYDGLIYLVIDNLFLGDWGNALPSISASISHNNTGELIGNKSCATTVLGTITSASFTTTSDVYSQTASSFEKLDSLIPSSIASYPYLANTSLFLPYTDIYNRIYSSSIYSGSDSELIQYNISSGRTISRRSLELGASPAVAVTFDYQNAIVYCISNTATYYFDMFSDIITDVTTTQLDTYTKLRESVATIGVEARDIYYKNKVLYAVRANITNAEETYLLVYKESTGFQGEVYGPLTHASHTNSFDASTTLDDGEFITVNDASNVAVIGSSTNNWLVSVDLDTGIPATYSSDYTIDSIDRANFGLSTGGVLNLNSGDRLFLPTFELMETLDILTLFSLSSYEAALWSDQLNGYIIFDSTQLCSGYVRNNFTHEDLDLMLEDIILAPQREALPTLTTSDLDFSNLSTETIEGYTIAQQSQVTQQIEPLTQVFAFDIIEEDGKLKSPHRDTASILTIAEDETCGIDGAKDISIEITRAQEAEMLREVTVSYSDSSIDYQQATQIAKKIDTRATTLQSVSLELVESADKMAQVADILLEDSWLTREKYFFVISREYIHLNASDIIDITMNSGQEFQVRINKIVIGDNGLLEISASANRASIYTSTAVGNISTGGKQTLSGLENIKLEVFDMPYIYSGEEDNYAIYAAVLSIAIGSNYQIETYKSSTLDGTGSKSSAHLFTNTEVPHGVAVEYRYNGVTTSSLYHNKRDNDYDVEIDVQILNGVSLAPITDKETMFLSQENFAVLGQEVFYYKEATSLGANKWTLTGLYRFRQNVVSDNINHSVPGGVFRGLSKESLAILPIGSSYIDSAVSYKAKTTASITNTSPFVTQVFESIASMPLPATRVLSTMSTDDIVLSWSRRDRVADNWNSYDEMGLSETTEYYAVEVLDSEGVVAKTIIDLTDPTYTYTSIDQISDFGSAQDTVLFRIYQISTLGTNGFAKDYVHFRNGDHFTDFEDDTLAAQAPNTTATWTTSNATYLIVAGKYLQIANTVAGYKALSFDAKHVTLDKRVKMKAKFSGAGASAIVGTYIVIHGTSDSGIIAYMSDDLTKIGIAYNNNGTLEDEVTTNVTIQEDVFYNIKVEVLDGTIKYKIWKAHLAEIHGWDLVTRIDSSFIGFAGIGQNSTALTIDIDHILIEDIE